MLEDKVAAVAVVIWSSTLDFSCVNSYLTAVM